MLGNDFRQNAVPVDSERDGIRMTGFAGLPTFNRANTQCRFRFVNGRSVRDSLLRGAAKAEVRFRDDRQARGLAVSATHRAIDQHGRRTSTTVSRDALAAMRPGDTPFPGRLIDHARTTVTPQAAFRGRITTRGRQRFRHPSAVDNRVRTGKHRRHYRQGNAKRGSVSHAGTHSGKTPCRE